MYYPIGWPKVLNLDPTVGAGSNTSQHEQATGASSNILSVQANNERDLFLILTTRSLHIWNSKPAVEIVCHRRSDSSINDIGSNKIAVWKTDSSVVVVATNRDQLLFYHVRRRAAPFSAAALLLQGSSDSENIYKLRYDAKELKSIVTRATGGQELPPSLVSSNSKNNHRQSIPCLTVYTFGKLNLSTIGISCLMPAQEEVVVGARNGDIYGVHWNGNIDEKFPWSLAKSLDGDFDYVVELKFSSVLSGFALVFNSGRVAFMAINATDLASSKLRQDSSSTTASPTSNAKQPTIKRKPSVSFLEGIDNACSADINHRYRLVAFGLRDGTTVVCNLGDSNSCLVINHTLELGNNQFPHDGSRLGPVTCLRYSPDNFALVCAWEGGDFAIWSVFGSLLFCSQQWQLNCGSQLKPLRITCLAWAREGYQLWMSVTKTNADLSGDAASLVDHPINGLASNHGSSSSFLRDESQMTTSSSLTTSTDSETGPSQEEVLVLSIARSSTSSSPHLTCTSDAVILMSEDKIYLGPSVPHKAEFDHWHVVEVPQNYLEENYPIRHATVDRECQNLAIAGNCAFAIYSIKTSEWKHFSKISQEHSFSVCGDIIWWKDYLVVSCFNLDKETFDIRAYYHDGELRNDDLIVEPTAMEIIRMSIFENRLLVLYSDGTFGMFMLNLRRKASRQQSKSSFIGASRSNSIVGGVPVQANGSTIQQGASGASSSTTRSSRSDSTVTVNSSVKGTGPPGSEFTLQIAPIENLIISNLQANAYCVSSIALTRLHFKNNRCDDSILMNACGKLFLLERETPSYLNSNSGNTKTNNSPTSATRQSSANATPSPTSDPPLSGGSGGSSTLAGQKSLNEMDAKLVQSVKRLSNPVHLAAATLQLSQRASVSSNVTFKAVSVIANDVEQFWISPELSDSPETCFFKKSLWLLRGGSGAGGRMAKSTKAKAKTKAQSKLQVWLPLLNDKNDPPTTDLYVPDRIMLPIKTDIYPLAVRSSAVDVREPDDAMVLGAESEILYKDNHKLFAHFPYCTVKRQCRVHLHRILRELLINHHLGYYARKIAEGSQSLPYFAHCFELLLFEVLEEEATSPVPLPDPMLPQVIRFIKQFPIYLETVVHCARKSELSMWSHLFDERAVGNPRRLFQECLDRGLLDIAASCLIILQSLDRNIVSHRMVMELIEAANCNQKYKYLVEDLENFLSRAELDYGSPPN